jgi:hypothetical protein
MQARVSEVGDAEAAFLERDGELGAFKWRRGMHGVATCKFTWPSCYVMPWEPT